MKRRGRNPGRRDRLGGKSRHKETERGDVEKGGGKDDYVEARKRGRKKEREEEGEERIAGGHRFGRRGCKKNRKRRGREGGERERE